MSSRASRASRASPTIHQFVQPDLTQQECIPIQLELRKELAEQRFEHEGQLIELGWWNQWCNYMDYQQELLDIRTKAEAQAQQPPPSPSPSPSVSLSAISLPPSSSPSPLPTSSESLERSLERVPVVAAPKSITNELLLTEDCSELRANLVEGVHYKLLPYTGAQELFIYYGGRPIVVSLIRYSKHEPPKALVYPMQATVGRASRLKVFLLHPDETLTQLFQLAQALRISPSPKARLFVRDNIHWSREEHSRCTTPFRAFVYELYRIWTQQTTENIMWLLSRELLELIVWHTWELVDGEHSAFNVVSPAELASTAQEFNVHVKEFEIFTSKDNYVRFDKLPPLQDDDQRSEDYVERQCMKLITGSFTGDEDEFRVARNIRRSISGTEEPEINSILIDTVVQSGVLNKMNEMLQTIDSAALAVELLWAITNVASGNSAQTAAVVDAGLIRTAAAVMERLPQEEVIEQVLFAFGNISGEGIIYHAEILATCVPRFLFQTLNSSSNRPSRRAASWCLSNLCRKSPYSQVGPTLSMVIPILHKCHDDPEEESNIAWAISYQTELSLEDLLGQHPELVVWMRTWLQSTHLNISTPGLRCIGNVCSDAEIYTQMIIDAQIVPVFINMLAQPNLSKALRREVLWTLSNIAAGSQAQVRYLIDIGGTQVVATMLRQYTRYDPTVLVEAAFVLSNALDHGNEQTVQELLEANSLEILIAPLTNDHLGSQAIKYANTVFSVLEALCDADNQSALAIIDASPSIIECIVEYSYSATRVVSTRATKVLQWLTNKEAVSTIRALYNDNDDNDSDDNDSDDDGGDDDENDDAGDDPLADL